MRVVADVGQPVNGAPIRDIAPHQFIGDARIDLTPRRGLVGHERQGVGCFGQVESGKCTHRRGSHPIPPGERLTAAAPVVLSGRLIPDEPQPASRARVETLHTIHGLPPWLRPARQEPV